METGPYPDFELCARLRDAGFPQRRRSSAMYYVRPDMLISIDDLSALKLDGDTDFENIFSALIFKPTIQDLAEASGDFFIQLTLSTGAGWWAYSNVQNPDAPAGTDPYVRANGTTEWEARANLYLAILKKQNHIVIAPNSLEQSDNIQLGEDAPEMLLKTDV